MDYTECLKVHGYVADKSDSKNGSSNVEKIYNKYKPPPVPYDEFKHRVVTIYADSGTASPSSSNASLTATRTANPPATVQRNRSRPVSNVQQQQQQQQQLDQFANSYQQRTDTPIRDILSRPGTVQPATVHGRAQVRTPRAAPVVPPPQPASRVFTLTPPPPAPAHSSWPGRRAVHREPSPPPTPSTNDIRIPYQPLVASECATHQPAPRRRPHRPRQQQQQDEEEEETNCCCCIC